MDIYRTQDRWIVSANLLTVRGAGMLAWPTRDPCVGGGRWGAGYKRRDSRSARCGLASCYNIKIVGCFLMGCIHLAFKESDSDDEMSFEYILWVGRRQTFWEARKYIVALGETYQMVYTLFWPNPQSVYFFIFWVLGLQYGIYFNCVTQKIP